MRGEANAFNLLQIDRGHVVVECFEWQRVERMFAVSDVTRFERTSSGWSTSNRS
jgi:hypothetical protein